MNRLILHPTALAQWHELVIEACSRLNCALSEELESYLVALLMRFINHSDVATRAMAIEFLSSLQNAGHMRQYQLREVGDQCLLIAGFFPGRAQQKRLKLSYFIQLGQTAYDTLSQDANQAWSGVFQSLAQKFVTLTDLLQVIRAQASTDPLLDPFSAFELWQDTHSQYAKQLLKQYSHHHILPFAPPKKRH